MRKYLVRYEGIWRDGKRHALYARPCSYHDSGFDGSYEIRHGSLMVLRVAQELAKKVTAHWDKFSGEEAFQTVRVVIIPENIGEGRLV